MKKRLNNKGFSLIELVLVIAIMAVLTSSLAPALLNYVWKTRFFEYTDVVCDKYEMTLVEEDNLLPDNYNAKELKGVFEDTNGNMYMIEFERVGGQENGYYTHTAPVLLLDHYDDTTEPELDETVINIPEGYKFVMWADEEKTSYIIEDENGAQSIIIINQN